MSSALLELIGPSGSGKSSFYRELLRSNKSFVGAYDYFIFGKNLKTSDKLKSLLVDFKSVFCAILYLAEPGFLKLLVLGIRWSFSSHFSFFHKLNFLRNFFKKLVLFYFYKNKLIDDFEIVVLDEGLLQMAHSFFVHPDQQTDLSGLDHFLKLLPVPDHILLLDANEQELASRLRIRRDIPMGLSVERAELFIAASRQVFDHIRDYYLETGKLIYCKNLDEAKNAVSKLGGFRYNCQSE